MDTQLSRRGFVGMAGAASLGSLVASGAALASEAPAQAWDDEADLVVVGFGGAGAGAAAKAAEAGADVLILEKFSPEEAGGDTYVNLGFVGVVSDDWQQYVAHSGGTATEEKARQICDAAHAAVEWVKTIPGVVYQDGGAIEGGAPALYEGMSAHVTSLPGVRVMYEAPACGLVFDQASGEVKGVKALVDGKEIAVKARKGVVLATGDYASSPELLSQFHYPKMPIANVGGPGDTGDGLRMAASVGAQLGHLTNTSLDWAGACFRKATEETGTAFYYNYGGIMEPEFANGSKIIVNRNGERFMNEETLFVGLQHNRTDDDHGFLDIRSSMAADGDYVNMPMFMVMDSKVIDNEPLLVNDGKGWRCKKHVYEWSADNQAEIERGWVLKADTLEELAALMASKTLMREEDCVVDGEALAQTVAAYNDGVAAGGDAFGRAVYDAIDTPPFYAVELIPCVVYLEGGPVVDEEQRVLNWSDEPIGRLYAAGNVCMGGELMPFYLSGAIGMGMDAGEHAVALESWEA